MLLTTSQIRLADRVGLPKAEMKGGLVLVAQITWDYSALAVPHFLG